jgi:uncharacterized protein YfaP (DUF2135 family)
MLLGTTTTVMGAFRAELPAGLVYAYFQLDGYLPATGEFEVLAVQHNEVGVTRLVPVGAGTAGELTGLVLDAETAEPIGGARIRVRAGVNASQGMVVEQLDADTDGYYAFPELAAGNYTLEGSADGYARSYVNATVSSDTSTRAPDLLLSRLLDGGQFRIVLSWGLSPSDLDAHLYVPPIQTTGFEAGFEVFYSQRGNLDSAPYAELDVDDTDSYGPETITISQVVRGTYHYVVHRFSSDAPFSDSGAQVSVFDDTGLVYTAFVPTTGPGDYWHVLDIDGDSLAITPVNERSNSTPF